MIHQRTLVAVTAEFYALLIEQNQVTLEVNSKRQLLQSWKDRMECSQHQRSEHGRYWDHAGAISMQRVYEKEAEEAEKRFRKNQERLTTLKEEIVTLTQEQSATSN